MNKIEPTRLRLDGELLRSFAAVAETGSFTGAAAAVGRTQSAISLQMQRLEALVGRTLFERRPRGVRLTAAGERLLGRARQMLALLEQTATELSGDTLAGSVRVGIPDEYGGTLLPGVLARFAEAQPDVQVTVACEPSPSLERSLMTGSLDLAVLVIDSGRGEGELLGVDPTVWVCSRTHDITGQDPLPVAMFDEDCWWRSWALRSLDDSGRRYRVAFSSRSVAGLQAAVTSGLAIAVLARSTMPAGSRILGTRDGFDELPPSRIVLRRAGGVSSPPIAGMADAIRGAFSTALAG